MKLLRYAILFLMILNLAGASYEYVSPILSTLLSYGTLIMLIGYYVLEKKKGKLNIWMIVLGLSYYLISSLQYYGDVREFVVTCIKYFIMIICGYEVAKNTTKKELFFFLLIGALSILFHLLLFKSAWGRYSGFYINPNEAGFMCISGYALTFGLTNKKLKLIGQLAFSVCGLLTFSRTFMLLWLLLNALSVLINIKNIKIFILGFGVIMTMFMIDELIGLDNPRFQQLKGMATNDGVSSGNDLSKESRAETWAMFYDYIFESPIIGNGYGMFQGGGVHHLGAHNSYLMIVGESGIIPFLIFIGYFAYLMFSGLLLFRVSPNLIMQSIGISVFLLASHNFFTFFHVIFLAIWIQSQASIYKQEQRTLPTT